jgi:hypothetical protein
VGIDLPSSTKTMINIGTKARVIDSIISNRGQITEVEKVILPMVSCTTNSMHVEPLIDNLQNVSKYVPMEVVNISQ